MGLLERAEKETNRQGRLDVTVVPVSSTSDWLLELDGHDNIVSVCTPTHPFP